jgi:predicted RNase H-like HicB family nuclease
MKKNPVNIQSYAMAVEFDEEWLHWKAWFPQFPNCATMNGVGKDVDHIMACGFETLEYHIEGIIEDGQTPPNSNYSFELKGRERWSRLVIWVCLDIAKKDASE